MTTPGDLKGASRVSATAPESEGMRGVDRRRQSTVLVSCSPTTSYMTLHRNYRSEFSTERPKSEETDLPKETAGPFPRQSIRFMMREGGNEARLTKVRMLAAEGGEEVPT